MGNLLAKWKSRTRVTLFSLGIMISVTAWLVDKTPLFPGILQLIAPDYTAVRDAFEILDRDEKAILPLGHQGSAILLRWWEPPLPTEITGYISGIGRSSGAYNLKTGLYFYELRLMTQDNVHFLKDFTWKDIRAKERMKGGLDGSLLWWSLGLFILGQLLTISMFWWENIEDTPPSSIQPKELANKYTVQSDNSVLPINSRDIMKENQKVDPQVK